MALVVQQLTLEVIAHLRPLVARIQRRDRALAQQLQRAASSIALNIGEAEYSDAGNRRARFHTAAGSVGETRTAVQVALAWGYLSTAHTESVLHRLDRIVAMLWRLSRGP